MSELKPCPFCGGDARLDCATDGENVSVYCVECEDECCLVKWYDTADEAIAAWNTRVSPDLDARIETAAEEITTMVLAELPEPRPNETITIPLITIAAIIKRHIEGGAK